MATFSKKKIKLTFTLGEGQFGENGSQQYTVEDMRTTVTISNASGPSMGQANIRVYGLTLDTMNQLNSYLPAPDGVIEFRKNYVSIDAGADNLMATIFQGLITLAPIDMNNQPNTSLVVVAHAGAFENVKPGASASASYPQGGDVYTIMASLAAEAGLTFSGKDGDGNNVSVRLPKLYLWGSVRDRMGQLAEMASVNWTIDNGVLVIWPKGGARNGAIPMLIADNGDIVGYPTNWNVDGGVSIKTIFNPNLRIGGKVDVRSSLKFATGRFQIYDISHDISAELPGGPWFTSFHGTPIRGQS